MFSPSGRPIVATSSVVEPPARKKFDSVAILAKAKSKALQGGLAGAASMGVNVLALMWLRTTVNYQYRYGTNTTTALRTLYADGGIPRFYRGLLPALFQGPMSRFGDTAANTGVIAAFESSEELSNLNVLFKTVAASMAAALFRIFLMPVDTLKTTMQVEGKQGIPNLMKKFRTNGPGTFYQGALAASSATFVGHYPWFATNNWLEENLPARDDFVGKLSRRAFIGFCSSAVSDTCSNSIRVIKVFKQASPTYISYGDTIKTVIAKDGVMGLMGRGLKTKIISNGFQGIMFSILWKYIMDVMAENEKKKKQ